MISHGAKRFKLYLVSGWDGAHHRVYIFIWTKKKTVLFSGANQEGMLRFFCLFSQISSTIKLKSKKKKKHEESWTKKKKKRPQTFDANLHYNKCIWIVYTHRRICILTFGLERESKLVWFTSCTRNLCARLSCNQLILRVWNVEHTQDTISNAVAIKRLPRQFFISKVFFTTVSIRTRF